MSRDENIHIRDIRVKIKLGVMVTERINKIAGKMYLITPQK
ncbi:MAG: hypothetical protein QW597_02080 [Thermoplasmataceae archaeon]